MREGPQNEGISIKGQRFLEFRDGLLGHSQRHIGPGEQEPRTSAVRFGQRVVQLGCFLGPLLGLNAVGPGVFRESSPQPSVELGQTRISGSITRVLLNRLLKTFFCPRPASPSRYSIEVGAAQQVGLVSFWIYASGSRKAHLFLWCQFDPNLAGHITGYLPLHGEDVPWIKLVSLRPEMALGMSPEQVGCDPDSVSRAEDGALEQRIHLEFLRDLRQWSCGLPVAKH